MRDLRVDMPERLFWKTASTLGLRVERDGRGAFFMQATCLGWVEVRPRTDAPSQGVYR